jgi:hypothetical protein
VLALSCLWLAGAAFGMAQAGAQPVRIDLSAVPGAARIVQIVRPEYPADAQARGQAGVVKVDVAVRPDGYGENYVYTADKPESSVFVDALRRVTRNWKFRPTLGEDCFPIATPLAAEVAFELDQGTPRIFVTPLFKPPQMPAVLAHQKPVHVEKPYYPWDREGIGIAAVTFVKFAVDRDGNVMSAKARSFTAQKPPSEPSPVSRELERRLADIRPFDQATELAVMSWKFPMVPPAQPAPWSACWEARFPESY